MDIYVIEDVCPVCGKIFQTGPSGTTEDLQSYQYTYTSAPTCPECLINQEIQNEADRQARVTTARKV